MKYFRVKMDSLSMCGFGSYGCFAAESERDLENDIAFLRFRDKMQDYVNGWVTDEDREEDDEADYITEEIHEITKEEYDQMMNDYYHNDFENPFHTG